VYRFRHIVIVKLVSGIVGLSESCLRSSCVPFLFQRGVE
jgi:hypothetical protein